MELRDHGDTLESLALMAYAGNLGSRDHLVTPEKREMMDLLDHLENRDLLESPMLERH